MADGAHDTRSEFEKLFEGAMTAAYQRGIAEGERVSAIRANANGSLQGRLDREVAAHRENVERLHVAERRVTEEYDRANAAVKRNTDLVRDNATLVEDVEHCRRSAQDAGVAERAMRKQLVETAHNARKAQAAAVAQGKRADEAEATIEALRAEVEALRAAAEGPPKDLCARVNGNPENTLPGANCPDPVCARRVIRGPGACEPDYRTRD